MYFEYRSLNLSNLMNSYRSSHGSFSPSSKLLKQQNGVPSLGENFLFYENYIKPWNRNGEVDVRPLFSVVK